MTEERNIWRIRSGGTVSGSVPLHGNKNAALPALCASLLLPLGGSLVLEHVPRIRDVTTLTGILHALGIEAVWTGPEQLTLVRVRKPDTQPQVPAELTQRIRGSLMLLGPLAGMYSAFSLPKPGGDKIGGRPIGAHISALEDLGMRVSHEGSSLICMRDDALPRGGTVVLNEQSVTATLMLLLYSAFLGPDDRLTIVDAACEPHVVTLCELLMAMGATIEGLYSNLLTVSWPNGPDSPAMPIRLDDDFMEAATYAIAAALTRGDVSIPFRRAGLYLHQMNRYLSRMGVATELTAEHWHVFGSRSRLAVEPSLHVLKAEPWPRFPTDVMSMFVILATQCSGTLKFIEYMYDDRFGFVQSLRDIGARIDTDGKHAIIVHGPTPLKGDELFLRPDIRSGAAMLLASLAASGDTVLHDRGAVIERGYQELPQTLALLGARIEKIPNPFS